MKKLFLILSTISVASCSALNNIPTSPNIVCDKTQLDERAGIAFEAAYKAFRIVIETGVDVELIHGDKAAKIRNVNTLLYNLTLTEQYAYKTCNATNYFGAIEEGKKALQVGYLVIGDK